MQHISFPHEDSFEVVLLFNPSGEIVSQNRIRCQAPGPVCSDGAISSVSKSAGARRRDAGDGSRAGGLQQQEM